MSKNYQPSTQYLTRLEARVQAVWAKLLESRYPPCDQAIGLLRTRYSGSLVAMYYDARDPWLLAYYVRYHLLRKYRGLLTTEESEALGKLCKNTVWDDSGSDSPRNREVAARTLKVLPALSTLVRRLEKLLCVTPPAKTPTPPPAPPAPPPPALEERAAKCWTWLCDNSYSRVCPKAHLYIMSKGYSLVTAYRECECPSFLRYLSLMMVRARCDSDTIRARVLLTGCGFDVTSQDRDVAMCDKVRKVMPLDLILTTIEAKMKQEVTPPCN